MLSAHRVHTHDDLDAAPIEPSWVLAGVPVARAKTLAATADGRSETALWDCTAGQFRWHFGVDETVHVLAGEVVVTSPSGATSTLREGDVAFFPAGTSSVWTVESYVKKLAFLRDGRGPLRRAAGAARRRLRRG